MEKNNRSFKKAQIIATISSGFIAASVDIIQRFTVFGKLILQPDIIIPCLIGGVVALLVVLFSIRKDGSVSTSYLVLKAIVIVLAGSFLGIIVTPILNSVLPSIIAGSLISYVIAFAVFHPIFRVIHNKMHKKY